MKHIQRFFWLDFVRGISALAVCVSHLRAVMFIDYAEIKQASVIERAFYFITGLGHESVMVFFVLSGFFVGGSILKKKTTFNWASYFIARLTRLWVVLIPALILTLLIDKIVIWISPDVISGAYYKVWNSGPNVGSGYSESWQTFLGNILFLQTILTPVFGTNSPLWSLANEFWYYILFPLCAYSAGQCFNTVKPKPYLRILVALIALFIFILLPLSIKAGYLVWLLGVVVYIAFDKVLNITYPLLISGLLTFSFSLLYSNFSFLQNLLKVPSDLVIGLGFSILCLALVNLPIPNNSILTKIFEALSEFSYSLYASHFPVVILVGTLYYKSNQLLFNSQSFTYFIGWLVVILCTAIAFWWAFEKRTNEIRKLIQKFIVI